MNARNTVHLTDPIELLNELRVMATGVQMLFGFLLAVAWVDDRTRNAPAISVRGLGKRFGDRVAFDDVSFDVGYSEVFGFRGPNGAGKTPTVRTLGTLLAHLRDWPNGSCSRDRAALVRSPSTEMFVMVAPSPLVAVRSL